MELSRKTVHLIGIGGIGVSAIAKLLLEKGAIVSGSDMYASDITRDLESLGVIVSIGHNAAQVPTAADFVIYSDAVPENNPERGIVREFSYAEFLGELSKDHETIVVSGTNGKSTTTAMLASIMIETGHDPTVVVGSLVPTFEMGNVRIGKGKHLILEGCEYRANVLKTHPMHALVTNVEEDHLDFYKDINHIIQTFEQFLGSATGVRMVNSGDKHSKAMHVNSPVTYGPQGNYEMVNRVIEKGKQRATVMHDGEKIGDITLSVPGKYNLENALGAIGMALELGAGFGDCQSALAGFKGIWRRYERVGSFNGAEIISDYGHHPTAVKDVIEATREFFPGRRIVLCFEPHQHSRTKNLMEEFVEALSSDTEVLLVIPEIYGVVGRTEPEETEVSSEQLVDKIKQKTMNMNVQFGGTLTDAEKILRDMIKKDDIVLIMGAGDVDMIARSLVRV